MQGGESGEVNEKSVEHSANIMQVKSSFRGALLYHVRSYTTSSPRASLLHQGTLFSL